jgi:O-antigen/teichoic acid export membrane protein
MSVGGIRRARHTVSVLGWDLPLFASATAVDQGGRLAVNLVAAGLLGPVAFGTWVALSLLLQYTPALGLGIANGVGREVPRLLGTGDEAAADHVEDVAAFGVLSTSLLAGLGAVAIAPLLVAGIGAETVVLVGVAAVAQSVFLFGQVLFRSRLRFRAASLQLAAQGIVGAVIGIVLLAAGLGVDGILLARVSVVGVAIAMAGRTLARVPRPRADLEMLGRLVAVGFPLMAAGILLLLLVTIDRWIVLAVLGQEALGVYGLVGLAASSLVLVPTIISQQYYPRLGFARGEGADGATLLRMARGQGLLAAGLAATGAAIVVLTAWLVIPRFLPEYGAALPAIPVILAGMVAYSAGSAYGNLLNLVDRSRRYLAIQVVVLASDIALCLILVSTELGILGAALGSALSMSAYAVLLHLASLEVARLPGVATPARTTDDDVPAPA